MNLTQMQLAVKESENQIRNMGRQVLAEYNKRWKVIREAHQLCDSGFDLCRIKTQAMRDMVKENSIPPGKLSVNWQIAEIGAEESLNGNKKAAIVPLPDMPASLIGKTCDPTAAMTWLFDWLEIPVQMIPEDQWPSMGAWGMYWDHKKAKDRQKWKNEILKKIARPAKVVAEENERKGKASASFGKIEKIIDAALSATKPVAAAGNPGESDLPEKLPP